MEPFVDILAAAAYLSVKISWVYEHVRLDRMRSSKAGHRRRFRLSELEAWVRGSRGAFYYLPARERVARAIPVEMRPIAPAVNTGEHVEAPGQKETRATGWPADRGSKWT